MERQLPLLLIGIVYFIFVRQVFAVAVSLSNVPSEITTDPFTLDVSITGAGAGTNYLRIELYKDGTTNYFGETYGADGWYGGSDYTQYLPITILSGQTWNGQIQGRVGNPTVTEYDSTGSYRLRVQRYTNSGSPASEANTTATTIAIVIPTITPTPTNVPTPTVTPKPPTATPTPKIPTVTPIPKNPTPSLATKPTEKTAIPTVEKQSTEKASDGAILGLEDEVTPPGAPTSTTAVLGTQTKSTRIVGPIFFVIGSILFGICGILLFRQYWKARNHESDSNN